jgi:hypothetical protein
MALAVREQLIVARQTARAAQRIAQGVGEKTALVLVLAVIAVAIVVASRLPRAPEQDPVLRRLTDVPEDDEGPDAAEEAAVQRARAEASTPWPQARQELAQPDP